MPRIMGILNVTPDSFSDGGRHADWRAAVEAGIRMAADGADIIDVGGESTRPGAEPVPLDTELRRTIPVVEGLVKAGVPVSIDSMKADVMRAALAAGATMLNDVSALQADPDSLAVAAAGTADIVLMHMPGNPQTMQALPMEGDVLPQVLSFLELQAQALQGLGVEKARIVLDPGIGFGKTVAQNFALLARQQALRASGYPVLAGWSRKSSLGAVTGLEVGERLIPSVAAALLAVQQGARIVRVHDVRETVAALAVWQAMQEQEANGGEPQ